MKKLIALFFVMVAVLSLAFASERTVGLIESDDCDAFDLEALIARCFPADFRTDDALIASRKAKQESQQRQVFEKALDAAYQKENNEAVIQASDNLSGFVLNFDETAPITKTLLVDYSDSLLKMFTSNDSEALSDYCIANSLDILILMTSRKINNLIRCRIFVFETEPIKVYEHICLETDIDFKDEDAVFSLMPYFYPSESSLIVFDDAVPEFASIKANGEFAVARPGTYEYQDANDEKTKMLEVPQKQIVHLSYSHDSAQYASILVTGSSQKTSIKANGSDFGNVPIVLDNLSIPFTMTASESGFKTQHLQSSSDASQIHFSMTPSWLSENVLYQKARDDFYWSFARSLVIFGAEVLISSMEDKNPAYKAAGIAVSGALAISLVDLFGNLFDYYRTSVRVAE